MPGVALLGCEPKAGKTYISALLLKALKQSGLNPGYFKCASTGVKSIEQSEAAQIRSLVPTGQELTEMIPYIYRHSGPVHLLGRKTGNYIDAQVIQEHFGWNTATHSCMVLEGIGDIISPLIMEDNEVLLQEDIISRLRLNVVPIVRMSAKSMNLSTLAVLYLRRMGLNVPGIIINDYDQANYAHRDSLKLIERFSQTPVIATVAKNQTSIQLSLPFDELFARQDNLDFYSAADDMDVSDDYDDITF